MVAPRGWRHARTPAALAALLLVPGCDRDRAGRRSGAMPIVSGVEATMDPGVVLLRAGAYACTGTLIASRVVLTARHCLAGVAIDELSAYFGDDYRGPGPWIAVTAAESHDTADLGAIELAEAAPAEPLGLNHQPLEEDWIGRPVRLVGFGSTGEELDDQGIKREGTTVLHAYDGSLMFVGHTGAKICGGDSGGPLLMMVQGQERLVGVNAFNTQICEAEDNLSGAYRVDAYLDWIEAFLAAHEGQADAGPPDASTETDAQPPGDAAADAAEPRGGSGGCRVGEPGGRR